MALSDRIVVMRAGKIEQIGTPSEIFFRPCSKFVATFMGAANFVEARVARLQERGTEVELLGRSYVIPFRANTVEAGDRVQVVVRPEAIQVTADAGSAQSAVINERTYLGGAAEYRLQIGTDLQLISRCAVVPDRPFFDVGQRVGLSFDVATLHYLPSVAN